ncbi:altered inheritance of mitochondria protein 21 [Xylaria longipes]|nr:altered inheritance of mitochondria protein 21 [Xylaria longipes]
MPSAPVVPPRPARSQEKDNHPPPTIPARPSKRLNRSISPNPDRFAPSPLNESPFNPKPKRNSQSLLGEELERSTSVDMPGVGEEGQEYAAAIEELSSSPEQNRGSSPEQTRIVGEDLKLHAPKPTVPAASAKQRVAAVTRTDSDRAAAFGIGRPSSEEPLLSGGRSLKKKASTTSQLSHHSELYTDDEHGIPEIGQRVPMLAYAGDVQAPSPAPPRAASVDSTKSVRHHTRRSSSRGGFVSDAPPGSYGLHGHGVESTDKLEKAYYEKHPDIFQKEHYHQLHGRVRDYSMSSENLNKIVRDTASRGAGFGTSEYVGTPSEQVGFQASDKYTSRMTSPQASSTAPKAESVKSPLKTNFSEPEGDKENNVIHVGEDGPYKGFVRYGDDDSAEDKHNDDDAWPILAADEVARDPSPYGLQAAVPPKPRGSDEPRSRPSSRPTSVYSPPPPEVHSTPLEDVEEYEPLFPEDENGDQKPKTAAEKLREYRQRFPSQDVWEDAPNSVHSTAEVSTPEPIGSRPKSRTASMDLPERDTETPAQAFARKQEELAEKESITPDSFLNRQQRPKSWVENQPHLAKEIHNRPTPSQRFPSRDVWEDTPDSLQFTTTVSYPQSPDNTTSEDVAKSQAPTNKPVIPSRPKKQGSGDDTSKPSVPNRPKPQIPARPRPAAESKELEGTVKQKPAVPARPVGSKIAALQAGFMSDLNNRLRLGPQAPKKDAPPEEAPEEKEKAPLVDARKGRARGPQRRAPTKSRSPGAGIEKSGPPPVSNGHPVLSFSMTRTLWSIDEEGTVTVDNFGSEKAGNSEPTVREVKPEEPEEPEQPEPVEISAEQNKPDETRIQDAEAVETKTEEASQQRESEKTNEESDITTSDNKPIESQNTVEETKSLVTNTAGESILTETINKKEVGDEVKEVEGTKEEVTS